MRRTHRIALLGLAALAAGIAIACSDDGGARVVVDGGGEITATATSSATSTATATPTAAGDSTSEATSTPTPSETATATPEGTSTATATATATPGANGGAEAGDLDGVPYSTADVRAAMAAVHRTFTPVTDLEDLCPNTSVAGLPFWAANTGGTDYGPVFIVWVYPDGDALAEDWDTGDRVDPKTDGCDLPTSYVYWNANTVLAFRNWLSLGEDIGPYDALRNPSEEAAVRAFLEMTPD